MQFTIQSLFVVLLAAWSTLALPVFQSRDVYDPPITYPKCGDYFRAGQSIVVTWDTSDLPADLQNEGTIILGFLTEGSENLDVEHPLAKDFLLTKGSHQITFPPDLPTRSNYVLVLMGDSGNISCKFTIESY